jgi:hypothetical protein
MLKEYLAEAVSLLAEAVLGKPMRAQAICYEYSYSNEPCTDCWDPSCGTATPKRKYKIYCNECSLPPPCWRWTGACYCNWC